MIMPAPTCPMLLLPMQYTSPGALTTQKKEVASLEGIWETLVSWDVSGVVTLLLVDPVPRSPLVLVLPNLLSPVHLRTLSLEKKQEVLAPPAP
jgi:hypothetical protein